MQEKQVIQILVNFMEIAALIFVSILYICIYARTRKLNISRLEIWNMLKNKFLICIFIDAILIFSDPFSEYRSYKYILLILYGMTENIDLFIKKIPTEFLVLEFILSITQIYEHISMSNLAASLLFSSIWILIKRKIRIGTNDNFLILILTVLLSNFYETILLNSVIMIIWGAFGIIMKDLFRKDPKTQIPLAPVIVTAFTLVKLLV